MEFSEKFLSLLGFASVPDRPTPWKAIEKNYFANSPIEMVYYYYYKLS